MITVEKVVEKNIEKDAEVAKDNEVLLKTGTAREVKKPMWPWFLGGGLLIVGAYFYFRRKGSGTNEGISG